MKCARTTIFPGPTGGDHPIPPNKTRITIRLDADILNWFRQQVHAQGGGSYQRLINEALTCCEKQKAIWNHIYEKSFEKN